MAKSLFISPIGIASWPHLVKPDTEGKFAKGKYATKLVLGPKEAEPFVALIDKVAKELGASPKVPYKPETIKQQDGTKKPSGNMEFSFSSKFAPVIMDAKNHPINIKNLEADFNIGSGSKIRLAGEFFKYDTGLSMQMKQVQVVELINSASSMFDEVEGNFDGSEFEGEAPVPGSFTESNINALNI